MMNLRLRMGLMKEDRRWLRSSVVALTTLCLLLGYEWSSVYAAAALQSFPKPGSTLLRIHQRSDRLVVGLPYDLPPFSYLDQEGQLTGFDVDLLEEVATIWGVSVEFVPANPAEILSLLASGTVDIGPVGWAEIDAGLLARTSENVDYSQPYLLDGWCFLVPAEILASQASATRPGSRGPRFGYIMGAGTNELDAYFATWLTEQPRFPAAGNSAGTGGGAADSQSGLLPFREHGLAISALKAGQLQGLFSSSRHCQFYRSDEEVFISHTDEEVGLGSIQKLLGISGRDAMLRQLVNHTLQTLRLNGQYAKLYQKWFPQDEPFQIDLVQGDWETTYSELVSSDLAEELPAREFSGISSEAQTSSLLQPRSIEKRVSRLRIGVPYDLPPFGLQQLSSSLSISGTGKMRDELVGYDIELAQALAGYLSDAPIEIELIPITPQTALPLLTQNGVDLVVGALTPTWEGESLIDYSEPYFRDQAALLVISDSGIKSHIGLAGGTVAYVEGDTAAERWLAEFRRLAESAPDFAPTGYLPFQEYTTALRSLKAGQVDGLIGGQQLLTYASTLDNTLVVVDALTSPLLYSIGISSEKADLRLPLNSALLTMRHEGFLQVLATRWFEQPLSTEEAVSRPARSLARPVATEKAPAESENEPSLADAQTGELPKAEPSLPRQPAAAILPVITGAFRTHTVVAGDTLLTLAVELYDDQSQWQLLYEANRALIGPDPNQIEAGMSLIVPSVGNSR